MSQLIENQELMTSLREKVNEEMKSLSTRVPAYSELTDEQKSIVDNLIKKIDTSNPETIDKFGRDETEKIYEELEQLVGTLKTHDLSIEEMFTDLMAAIDESSKPNSKGFLESIKGGKPLTALRSLKNGAKKMVDNERYRRANVLTNINEVQKKLEEIRTQLRVNSSKLEIIAQNSAAQYQNCQYQIIALNEVLSGIRGTIEESSELAERDFSQINRNLVLEGVARKITRKIDNCKGVSINAATKAIMSRILAVHNEELASDYDQDLSTLIPELKGVIVTAEANDSLIQAVDTHNQFVAKMNEMLVQESNRSREAVEKVRAISKGSAIDVETTKVLTSNVLEAVKSIKQSQDEGRETNEAFSQILEDFRVGITKELSSDKANTDSLNGKPIYTGEEI